MLFKNIGYINQILNKKEIFNLYIYFFFSILIGFLEIIGLSIIPVFFAVLIDQNILINKLEFNPDFQNYLIFLLDSPNVLFYLCIGTIIFFLFKSFIIFLFFFFDAKMINNLKVSLSSRMLKIYLKKNYIFHSANNPMNLMRNITSEVNISVLHIRSFLLIIKEFIQLSLIFLLILFANPKITILIFLILIIISFVYIKIFGVKLKSKSEISFHERGFKSKIVNQILNSIIEVKIYAVQNYLVQKFTKSIQKEFRTNMFLDIINKVPRIFIELLIVSLICITLLVSVNLGYDIQAMIALLTLYFVAILRAFPSINSILMQNMALINGKVSISKLSNEFKNSKLEIDEKILNNSEFDFSKSISFKNVSFNYPDRSNILKNLNFTIYKNTITGLKGETGSGKSTLIKLIINLLKPSNGKINIDDTNLESLKNKWQQKISYVPQNYYLLDDTILENIIFNKEEKKYDLDKINEILKFCNLDKIVKDLPKGLDTIVGPSGKLLSGGQAQRLSISRALYQDREVLIFDEATNALDEETENQILRNILKLKKTKTIILISHNKKIFEICDQILDLKKDEIIVKSNKPIN